MTEFRVFALVNENTTKSVRVPARDPNEATKAAVAKIREDAGVSVVRILKTKLCRD